MILQIVLAGLLAIGLPVQSLAQQQQPTGAPPPAGGAPPATAPEQAALSTAQLDALLAPVALYPDTLLAQVLMASTYPLEVIQAERWVAENKKLKGDQLKAAAEKQPWDNSVKALVATPSVLEMMSKNLEWTQKLGDAVLAQQPDVMDAVQRMRSRAHANKKLSSGSQQTVTVKEEGGRQTIAIEPAAADTVYVPHYDPGVVYGSWPYPESPPYYFPYTGYIGAGVVATGIAFGAAYALGRWAWSGSNYWGGNINWNGGNINIDRDRVTHWQHNPQHRQGVRYGNAAVQQRFAGTARAGAEGRMDFRGRGGDQVQRPGGSRPERPSAGAGARADRGPGARPDRGTAARPDRGQANRPAAASRAGGGRQSAQRAAQAKRPASQVSRGGGPRRDSAFGNMQPGRAANLQSQRGQASFAQAGPRMGGGGFGGGPRMGGGGFGGGPRMGGGGFGGGRGGGGFGGGGRGGGGRRSDINLKDQIVQLGRLGNGLGFYRFAYKGSDTLYVGVMAQEVRNLVPGAVTRGADGYLRVQYDLLGLRFQRFDQWMASGARVPAVATGH